MWSSIYKNVAVAANFMETFISLSPSTDSPPPPLALFLSFLCGALIGYWSTEADSIGLPLNCVMGAQSQGHSV